MNELARRIAQWRESKTFRTPNTLDDEASRDAMLGKLMLVVTEIAEAAEAVRHTDDANFAEEIADAMIRLLDITGTMGIDIEREINKKMEKNVERPVRHGKHCSL